MNPQIVVTKTAAREQRLKETLRLVSFALPQRSFDAIIQGIENIRELTAPFDAADRVKTTGTDNGRNSAGRRCTQEVRNGRT